MLKSQNDLAKLEANSLCKNDYSIVFYAILGMKKHASLL